MLGCLPQLAALRLHFDDDWRNLDPDYGQINGPELPCAGADVGDVVVASLQHMPPLRFLDCIDWVHANLQNTA